MEFDYKQFIDVADEGLLEGYRLLGEGWQDITGTKKDELARHLYSVSAASFGTLGVTAGYPIGLGFVPATLAIGYIAAKPGEYKLPSREYSTHDKSCYVLGHVFNFGLISMGLTGIVNGFAEGNGELARTGLGLFCMGAGMQALCSGNYLARTDINPPKPKIGKRDKRKNKESELISSSSLKLSPEYVNKY